MRERAKTVLEVFWFFLKLFRFQKIKLGLQRYIFPDISGYMSPYLTSVGDVVIHFAVQNYKEFLEYARKACFICYFSKNFTGIYEENYKEILNYANKSEKKRAN